MNVTRLHAAPEYLAPNHFDMRCLRLQGREAGPAEQLWLGVSIIAPGRPHRARSVADREALRRARRRADAGRRRAAVSSRRCCARWIRAASRPARSAS